MMGCNRAFDIDLAAFLADPRAEAFADFRAHYPRCAACAAEVRVWTELTEQLGGERHPAAVALAEYASLPASERAAIDRHAAGCARCREELRLLEAFDPAQLTRPAPVAAAEPAGPDWLERLARIFWHPAFAYGVALLVVAPLLWRTQGPGALAPHRELHARLERENGPTPAEAQGVARQARRDVAQERRALEPRAAAEGAGLRADRVADAPEPSPAADEVPEAAALAPAPNAQAQRARAAVPGEGPGPTQGVVAAKSARSAARAPGFAEAEADAPRGASLARAADAAAPEPPRLAPVALLGAPEQVSVRIPVRDAAHREVEVQVSDPSGERSRVQRAAATPGRLEVAVELPRSWLTPGLYRVELRDGNAPVQSYALPVVER